jgi:hypothetical protein
MVPLCDPPATLLGAGNYVTSNGRDPYLSAGGQVEERLWNEVAEEKNVGERQENPLVGPADPL